MVEGPGQRDVAVISVAVRQEEVLTDENEVQLLVDLVNRARNAVGLSQTEIGFTCSGSSDDK